MPDVSLSIQNSKKPPVRKVVLTRLKDAVLGKHYRLSIVFTNAANMRRLNRAYRKIDGPTDILSFPLSETEGEIFVAPAVARREAVRFNNPFPDFLLFLFIHGFLHLKGMGHGSRMEAQERTFRKKFNI